MAQVKTGDKVNVHYHGKLEDGTTFDSSEGRAPLAFTAGSGQVIAGFDNAVIGMNIGDKKTVHIPIAEAYGDRDDTMIIELPLTDFPADQKPEVGMELQMSNNHGNLFNVVITEIRESTLVLDANHPLAGMPLVFDIELVSID